MNRFVGIVPDLVELGALQTSVLRLADEVRKTQRRCNALSRIFLPLFRESIAYISGSLEERERESLIVLKMIRDRLGTRETEQRHS
jgi:V/A-type H+-transporting ATPase subunit D